MTNMESELLGVRVANPELNIEIAGQSFGDSLWWFHVHKENLDKILKDLLLENPHGENERLAAVQSALQWLTNTTQDVLDEHLRIARAQGLRFEFDLVKKPSDLH